MSVAALAEVERFVIFDCEGSSCVGVLSMAYASAPKRKLGVLIVVGGPQYRVGSHRQFALLARALGKEGFSAFRFDYRGMGDSDGEARGFDDTVLDIARAADSLCREAEVPQVVLWGLCDGASAALMSAADIPCVAGIVAVNPWARSPQGEAATRLKYYYVRRLGSADFWRKFISGRFEARNAAAGVARTMRSALGRPAPGAAIPFLRRMEEGWRRFHRPILILLSGNDLTAREFEAWVAGDSRRAALARGGLTEIDSFPAADHTFSTHDWRDAVAAKTVEWVARIGNGQ